MPIRRYHLAWYAGLVFAPLLLLQGLWLRRRIERLPDAQGDAVGRVGDPTTAVLRLNVVGESPVAGVGVANHTEGLACQAAQHLAGFIGGQVEWSAEGLSGSNAQYWVKQFGALSREPVANADVIVVVLGVNDTTGLVPLGRWRRDIEHLIDQLRGQAALLVFSAVPPVGHFTALAAPLRWWLGWRALMLDHALKRVVCGVQPNSGIRVSHLDSQPSLRPEMLARDGFHPSARGYRQWGERLAEHIVTEMRSPDRVSSPTKRDAGLLGSN
ncbi:SGNH/GDSL hydrolase family protein [Aestuariirhabdus sp. LZHN29]|uniref:SGNH/GDSL hydrolase family protein n=1 Tax=Aestuariirhabdus sp. LZHN29 TaxID=3417462 RepID=UPI003CFB183E